MKNNSHFQIAWDIAKANKENIQISVMRRFFLALATISKCYSDLTPTQFQVAQRKFIKGDQPFKFYYNQVKQAANKATVSLNKHQKVVEEVTEQLPIIQQFNEAELLIKAVEFKGIFPKISEEKAMKLAQFSLSSMKELSNFHYQNTCKLFASGQFETIEECYQNSLIVEKIMTREKYKHHKEYVVNNFGEIMIQEKGQRAKFIPVNQILNYKFS